MTDQKELKRFALKTISDALKKHTNSDTIEVKHFEHCVIVKFKDWFVCDINGIDIYDIEEQDE